MSRTYVCELCKEENIPGWSEEEAKTESDLLFPELKKEQLVQICDDCFHMVMDFNEPNWRVRKEILEEIKNENLSIS